MSILVIKTRSDSREDPEIREHDLDFVRGHIAAGWGSTLTVQEVDEGSILRALTTGRDAVDLLSAIFDA